MSNQLANRTVNIQMEKIKEYSVSDTRFHKVKIWLMHLEENYNGSIFTKEATTKAIPSLSNTPILGYIESNSNGVDDFSDHRMELEKNDGKISLKYKGKAYGVIPESNNARFEKKVCSDGKEREFLVCDGLVWTKFDEATDILGRDGVKDESMELAENYSGSFNTDGYFVFDDFFFDGACMLGNGVQPAMEGACVELSYSMNEIESKIKMFQNAINNQISEEFDIENLQEGVKEKLNQEQINSILEEFSLELSSLDFEITEDMTEESLRLAITEFTNKSTLENEDSKVTVSFSSTYGQKRTAIANAFSPNVIKNDKNEIIEETYFYLSDFDDTYAYVEKDVWTTTDWKSTFGRVKYTFDEATLSVTLEGELEEMVRVWLTVEENQKVQENRLAFEKLTTDFEDYKTNYTVSNDEVSVLKEAESQLQEIKEAKLFSKFDSLIGDMDEYSTLKKNVKEYSLSTLEEKCFSLLGKKNLESTSGEGTTPTNFNRIPLPNSNVEEVEDPYGGILAKYYNK